MEGNIEATDVIIIEQRAISIIKLKSISDGIWLKKYISSGNKLRLKKSEKKIWIFWWAEWMKLNLKLLGGHMKRSLSLES